MKIAFPSARLAVLPLAAVSAFPWPAFAQAAADLPETVVTATRSATRADELTSEVVVPKWAARCSAQCVADFNATIGKAMNITAKK